jgi:uncharacterized protein YgfB (UPF0149 family)
MQWEIAHGMLNGQLNGQLGDSSWKACEFDVLTSVFGKCSGLR